jgi:hypothetical protein
MLYVYGFCYGSATAAVEEYSRRFPTHGIPDRRGVSKVLNQLREHDTLPVRMFHLIEHINNMQESRETFLKWYNIALLLACEDPLHVSVFHEHMHGEHCMMTSAPAESTVRHQVNVVIWRLPELSDSKIWS